MYRRHSHHSMHSRTKQEALLYNTAIPWWLSWGMTENTMALMIEISINKKRAVNPNTGNTHCVGIELAKVPQYYFNVFHNKQHMQSV